jgi:hypothetical protein
MVDERLHCIDCKASVPEIDSNEEATFTSSTGWRLRFRMDDKGGRHAEWRCPQCWTTFKRQAGR